MPREYSTGPAEEDRSHAQAVKVTGGTTVYLAGVAATTYADGKSLTGDFEGQTRATFERLRQNIERAGGTLDDIVTMTVFVTDMQYGTLFTQLRKEYFTRGFPGSALVGVASLATPEMMVEIQAIAVVGD